MNKLLQKHRAEILQALRNNQFERTPDGIFLRKQNVGFGGVFRTRVNGENEQIDANTMMLAGLSDILQVYFDHASARTAFYIAPFSNNVTPTDDLTNLTIVSTLGEFTHYTEGSRQTWAEDDESGQSIGNSTSPATFTADSTAGTVWGAWLTTSATKSSTTSQLALCASKFGGSRVLTSGDKLTIEYVFSAADGA